MFGILHTLFVMLTGLRAALRTVIAFALFSLAVVIIFFGGQAIYSLPGNLAKSLSYLLIGTEHGPLATLLFFAIAAVYVGGISTGILLLIRGGIRGGARKA